MNGFAHRIASAEASNRLQLSDLIKMKLAFDKANVPVSGRLAIVDPITAATLSGLVTITGAVTDFGKMVLESGFSRDHQYIMNLYGFDIITSNRLAKGTFSDGTVSVSNSVANVFMCMADDYCKPVMAAWRRMPRVEGERNKDLRRDEFGTSARWGFGGQRVDTLGVYITSAVNV